MQRRSRLPFRSACAAVALGASGAVFAASGAAGRERTLEILTAEGVAGVVTLREDPAYVVAGYDGSGAEATAVLRDAGLSVSADVTVTPGPGDEATIDAAYGVEGLGASPRSVVRLLTGSPKVRMARIFESSVRTSAHAPPGATTLLASIPHPVRAGCAVRVAASADRAGPGSWTTTSTFLAGRDGRVPKIRTVVRDGAQAVVRISCTHTHVAGSDVVDGLVVPRLGAAVAETTFEITPRVEPADRGLVDLDISVRGTLEFGFARGSVETPAGMQRTLTPETESGETTLVLDDVPDGFTTLAGIVRAVLTSDGLPRLWAVIATTTLVASSDEGGPLQVDVTLSFVRPE